MWVIKAEAESLCQSQEALKTLSFSLYLAVDKFEIFRTICLGFCLW